MRGYILKKIVVVYICILISVILVAIVGCDFTKKNIQQNTKSVTDSNSGKNYNTNNKINFKNYVNENSNSVNNASDNNAKTQNRQQSKLQIKLHKFISNSDNQKSVEGRVLNLNSGNLHLGCVYFVSESLRRIGVNVPINICDTSLLTTFLKKQGWEICYDAKKLLPGDICFTTNGKDINKPTHTYIFMGWIENGDTKFAYVCDNQSYDFGESYHKRNITVAIPGKEAFYYFMYKPL
jgi:hypothetical protein